MLSSPLPQSQAAASTCGLQATQPGTPTPPPADTGKENTNTEKPAQAQPPTTNAPTTAAGAGAHPHNPPAGGEVVAGTPEKPEPTAPADKLAPTVYTSKVTDQGDSSQSVFLGPKFVPGTVSVYEFKADSSSVQKQGTEVMPSSTYTETVMRLTVKSVNPDGSATLTMTYDRLFFMGSAYFGGDYFYDSTDPKNPKTDAGVARVLNLLKDSTITAEVDAKGEVTKVTGFEKACNAMAKDDHLKARVNEFNQNGLPDMLESMWHVGNEATTRNLNAKWTDEQRSKVEGLGDWVFSSNYDVSKIEPAEAIVNMNMVISLDFHPPTGLDDTGDMLPVKRTQFKTDEGTWRYVWDTKRHELKERRSTLTFNWLMEQEGIFQGQDLVRTEQQQSVKSSLVRIDPK